VKLSSQVTAVTAAALLACAWPAGGVPARAEAACGSLKADPVVVSSYPKAFAGQYDKRMKVAVERGRERVRDWRVELYTFGGFLVGKSRFDKSMSRRDHASVSLRLAIQPGKYTLVTKGEVRGCGLIERNDVVAFRGCLKKLPVKFLDKPGGTAADYGKYLSMEIEPKPIWAPITQIRSTLSSFDGDIFGRAELPPGQRKLIGRQFLHHRLKSGGLQPGGYTVTVTGKARQPRSCGSLSRTTSLSFK
jgi:hypothetical protein